MNPTIFNVQVMTRTVFSVRERLKRGILTFPQRRRFRLLKSTPVLPQPSTLYPYALPPGHQYFCRPRPFSVGMSDGPSSPPASSPDQVGAIRKADGGRRRTSYRLLTKAVASIQYVLARLSMMAGLSSRGSSDGVDFRAYGWREITSTCQKTDDFPSTNG